VYSETYYARDVETAATEAAPLMAASLAELFNPSSVIDVGCGTGALLQEFQKLGCSVLGLEYADAGLFCCRKRGVPCTKFDITRDKFNGRYDLAISFEVAEHVAPWSANRYVKLLCGLSNNVVISAATPGQGGTDHINEQPRSYWIKKFEANGYRQHAARSRELSSKWRSKKIANFYSTNVLVFVVNQGEI
jgi:SAM-dependent methyltransferase